MNTIFQTSKLVAAPEGEDLSRPWFVIETNFTSDGPRTRVCEGRWATFEEADHVRKQKEIDSAKSA